MTPDIALISGPQRTVDAPNLVSLVQAAAQRRGSAIAIEDGDESISYDELILRARSMASNLIHRFGIRAGDVVAVSMDRSIAFICTVLGVQCAGAVYLPVIPLSPEARRQFVLKDAAAKLLILDEAAEPSASGQPCQTIAARDLLTSMPDAVEATWPVCGGQDISYIAYTSGTTGQPKGVQITHAGICNRIVWMLNFYKFGPDDAILCKCPIDFDPSLFEIFMPLSGGGRVVILKNNVQLSAESVISAIERYRITFLNLVPIVLRQILIHGHPEQCQSLRHIVCGGEAWESALIQKTHERFPQADLYNGYGPTETSIGVTIWQSDRRLLENSPPIGRPIDNVHLLIVDEAGRPVDVGQEGELWIGGIAVSPGYLGDIEQNANFVKVDFDSGLSMRFYKTGDMVAQGLDGQIAYVGRRDQQVKINGVRVELEEIESVAHAVSGVEQAGATVNRIGGIAYVSLYFTSKTDDPSLADRIRNELHRRVKPQVMPQRILQVPGMPTKANGKLDRSRLGTAMQRVNMP